MQFIVEGTKYDYDQNRLTFAEARAIEKATGRTMADITENGAPDTSTIQAMIWVAMKRTEPTLRFSDLDDMSMGDIEILPDEDTDEDTSDGQDGAEAPDPPVAAGDGGHPETVGPSTYSESPTPT